MAQLRHCDENLTVGRATASMCGQGSNRAVSPLISFTPAAMTCSEAVKVTALIYHYAKGNGFWRCFSFMHSPGGLRYARPKVVSVDFNVAPQLVL